MVDIILMLFMEHLKILFIDLETEADRNHSDLLPDSPTLVFSMVEMAVGGMVLQRACSQIPLPLLVRDVSQQCIPITWEDVLRGVQSVLKE